MPYRFEHSFTKKDMELLSRLLAKTTQRWSILFRRALYGIFVLTYSVMSALFFWSGLVLLGLLFLAGGLLFLVLFVFWHPLAANRGWKRARDDYDMAKIALEKDGIYSTGKLGESRYPYESLTVVYQYQGRYFLFVGKGSAIILAQEDLVEGAWDTLPAFLEEKTGKPVEEIK